MTPGGADNYANSEGIGTNGSSKFRLRAIISDVHGNTEALNAVLRTSPNKAQTRSSVWATWWGTGRNLWPASR